MSKKNRQNTTTDTDTDLRAALDGSPIGVVILDRNNGEILFANTALAKMFGVESVARVAEMDHTKSWVDQAQLEEAMAGFARKELLVNFEAHRRREDDSRFWVLMNTQLVTFEGRDAGIIWHVYITARMTLGKMTSAIENISDGFAIYDHDDRLNFYNTKFAEIFGFNDEDLREGVTLQDLVALNNKRGLYADGEQKKLSSRSKRHDDEDYITSFADGRMIERRQRRIREGGSVILFTDITERLRAEKELAEKEAQLRLTLDNMPGGILLIDKHMNYVLFNSTYPELFDFPAGLLKVGANSIINLLYQAKRGDFGAGDPEELAGEWLSSLYAKNELTSWERTIPSGRILHGRSHPTMDGGRVMIFTDITERKHVDEELEKAQEALTRQRDMQIATLETAEVAIAAFDGAHRLIMRNNRFIEIFGFGRAVLKNEPTFAKLVADLDTRLDKSDPDIVDPKVWTGRLTSGKPVQGELKSADGDFYSLLSSPSPDGGFVLTLSNITERREAALVLGRARDEAEIATKAKSEFVAMVSHEVRTPMNGILGMARMLLDTTLAPEQRDFAQNVVSSGEALLTILNDLLDISKLETGKLEIETVAFAPGQMIADAVSMMASNAQAKGLDLTCDISPELPEVLMGDVNRLRQILFNLLSNAIKFTSSGGVTVAVTGTMGKDGKSAFELSVADTGVGLTKKDAGKLFAPYMQANVEVARKYGGTGLGLAICRQLAELMGGEIRLESKRGKGSTFSLVLSLDVGDENDVLVSMPDMDKSSDLAFAPRVLLADDNEMNRKVAAGLLRKMVSHIAVAENGQQALDLMNDAGPFDVVLMDRHMPGIDGLEATRKIRALKGPASDVPIIGLTAAATRQEIDGCLEAGMNDVVTKPIDPAHLKDSIRRLIGTVGVTVDANETVAIEPVDAIAGKAEIFEPAVLVQLGEDFGDDAIADFTTMFRDMAPDAVAKFAAAAEAGDLPVMTLHAHDLKSSAAIVGLMRLSQLCLETEHACVDERIEDARALGEGLPATLAEAEKALATWETRSQSEPNDGRAIVMAQTTHDLRGIMNRMLGAVTNLEDGIDAPPVAGELEEQAAALLLEGQQMIDLAGDLTNRMATLGVETEAPQSVPDPDTKDSAKISTHGSILVVEDDLSLARTLTSYLNKQGFEAASVGTSADMFKEIETRNFDCYVVDLTLPDEDGIVLIRKLRARTDAPIVVQTGREDLDDKLAAFELGANDYVTKPVDPRELTMRLKSLIKRSEEITHGNDDILHMGDFVIDRSRHEVSSSDGSLVDFTQLEFQMLWALSSAEGLVVSRDTLVDAVYSGDGPDSLRAIDIVMSRLRKKLGKQAVLSVRGQGYKCGLPVSRP